MQVEYMRKCSLCLLTEKEVAPFLQTLQKRYPEVEITLCPASGTIELLFQGGQPVDGLVDEVQQKFPSFFYGEGRIEEALAHEMTARKKTVAFAESCTGGALAAKVTALSGASQYFLGSIVAYSSKWKEHFLQVSRTTLQKNGAVCREVVTEMVQGLFHETDADYAAAISGVAGPRGGTKEIPVGTICIAIGCRGEKIDAGIVHAPEERLAAIDLAAYLTLGALWRRLVHKTATFS